MRTRPESSTATSELATFSSATTGREDHGLPRLAYIVERRPEPLAHPEPSSGSPELHMPEQATGQQVDRSARAIYSLGAALYHHMLTGAPPVPGFEQHRRRVQRWYAGRCVTSTGRIHRCLSAALAFRLLPAREQGPRKAVRPWARLTPSSSVSRPGSQLRPTPEAMDFYRPLVTVATILMTALLLQRL